MVTHTWDYSSLISRGQLQEAVHSLYATPQHNEAKVDLLPDYSCLSIVQSCIEYGVLCQQCIERILKCLVC